MPRRLAMLAAVVLVALLGGSLAACGPGGGDQAAPRPTTARPQPPRGYAYLKTHFGQDWTQTTTDLVVMNGTKRVGHAKFGFVGSDPAYTTDGRYAFSLPVDDQVIAVSVATGKPITVTCKGCADRTLKCQCQTVVPVGGSEIGWLDSRNQLVRADLGAKQPTPRQTAVKLPTWKNIWDTANPQLLAGTKGAVLAGYTGTLSEQTGPVYLAPTDGKPRRLDTGRKDVVESAEFSPDGSRVAVYGESLNGMCTTITVVDLESGKGKTSRVHTAPGAKCVTRDGYIGDLWWDSDGTLNAYYQPHGDAHVADVQLRLDGDRWVAAKAPKATQLHHLDAGGTAILSHPGVRDKNDLYVEIGGKRTKVDSEVTRVVAAPN